MFDSKRRQFENLYRRQNRRLHQLAMSLTGFDENDARDVTQEVFIRAFQAFDRYRDEGTEWAWLRSICVNFVRERYRRSRFFRENVQPEIFYTDTLRNRAANPHEAMENIQLTGRIISAMKELPVEFREVLVMRHIYGLSTAETGETLDIPEGTVRSRLKRAREMLVKHCLREEKLP